MILLGFVFFLWRGAVASRGGARTAGTSSLISHTRKKKICDLCSDTGRRFSVVQHMIQSVVLSQDASIHSVHGSIRRPVMTSCLDQLRAARRECVSETGCPERGHGLGPSGASAEGPSGREERSVNQGSVSRAPADTML